jgi:hypothetical protein
MLSSKRNQYIAVIVIWFFGMGVIVQAVRETVWEAPLNVIGVVAVIYAISRIRRS